MAKGNFTNALIAELLRSVAAAYEVKGGNRFKTIAYENAATSIEHATSEVKDLWEAGELDSLPSVGKSIQGHLGELFKTGRVKHFEELFKGLPKGMFPLMEVAGIGPKGAYKLAKELKVDSVADLEKAAKADKIAKIEGFGKGSQENILKSLKDFKGKTGRMILPIAFPIAEEIVKYLKKHPKAQRVEPLGSLRRMVSTVGDIDIAVASDDAEAIVKYFTDYPKASRVVEAGPRTSTIMLANGAHIDLMVEKPQGFGALLHHFTGSKYHNIKLREMALKRGMSISDYGVKVKEKLKLVKTEEELFEMFGMQFIPPEMREDAGEIEAALEHKLPKLVELGDIKGDLHLHSLFNIKPSHDLGVNSIEEIVEKATKLGYEYVGISDHNPAVSTNDAKQMCELVVKRNKEIDEINNQQKKVRVLKLLEIDIQPDGTLSVPNSLLDLLDGALVSIHSSFRQLKPEMTERILKGLNHPKAIILSHPTARLLKKREGIDADWTKVFQFAVRNNKLLEINAYPTRLDLPDVLVREAVKNDVKMIINTDAHANNEMDNMLYGVAVARRGWATRKDIVNTLPWEKFRKLFNN